MLRDYLLPDYLISLYRIPKISTKIYINIIQIDILYLFVQFPIRFRVSYSIDKTHNLPDIPSNHQNEYNYIISFDEFAIILLIFALIRKNQ